MPQTSESVKPQVDDQYWFEFSKKMVDSGVTSRNEAAAKLQTLIVWLWGIYTASAAVGISLSKTFYSLPIILLIASPSFVLIIAYWLAHWVQMPIGAKFDPRIPWDIKQAYLKAVNAKSKRLFATLALSLLAAVLVSFALIAASVTKQATPPNFQAYYRSIDGHNLILISGHLPADTEIVLKIAPINYGPAGIVKTYMTPPSGELTDNIELPSPVQHEYEASAEWREKDGLVRSMMRRVLAEKTGK